jgi:hypothetical protein
MMVELNYMMLEPIFDRADVVIICVDEVLPIDDGSNTRTWDIDAIFFIFYGFLIFLMIVYNLLIFLFFFYLTSWLRTL